MNTYYIKQNNQDQGPYTLDQLSSMWKQGAITADAVYRIGSEGPFYPITALLTPPVLDGKTSKLALLEKPNVFIRGIAAIIDFVGIFTIAFLAGGILQASGVWLEYFFNLHGTRQFFWVLNCCTFVTFVFFLSGLRDGFGGRSPAKRLFGLIVISPKTLESCGFVKSFVRNSIMLFYLVLFSLYVSFVYSPIAGFLMLSMIALVLMEIIFVIARGDGRGLHDLGAETQVIFYKEFKTLKEASK